MNRALLYSHAILHLPKCPHDIDSVCFASCLLNCWILWNISIVLLPLCLKAFTHIYSHKDIIFLSPISLRSVGSTVILKPTFSSPIVNFPWVCSLFSAKDCSFFTGSVCNTVVKNLTFCFVYSCPGCPRQCHRLCNHRLRTLT